MILQNFSVYSKGALVQNAIQGYEKSGIWPYNPHVFGDEDYAPSSMIDRPLEENIAENIASLRDNIPPSRANIRRIATILYHNATL